MGIEKFDPTGFNPNLNEEYRRGFISQIEAAMAGNAIMIPNPIEALQTTFNLMQSRFTLLGSTSGAGKSSFIDDLYILKPWRQLRGNDKVHYEVLYYSMERKKMFKHAKWLSWMLHEDHGWLIPSDDILGWNPKGVISKSVHKAVRSYDEEMSDLLDTVHIYDGTTSVDKIANAIRSKAKQLGTLFTSDNIGVKKWGKGNYIAKFSAENIRQTRTGPIEIASFVHMNKKYQMEPNKREYVLLNPHTFITIVLDGVGLIQPRQGQSTKQAVDEITQVLADARDVFGFSPVMVSQFNRGIADVHRQKAHGADLSPQESDFKDSGGPFQAADLVLGLFDPVRFKAYDKAGFYGGYDVLGGMKVPRGPSRFRSLHILKNSFGVDNKAFGLGFWGECNYFEALPTPNKEEELAHIYAKIISGK
tara:strand:+ start:2956 stop:4209 length:1254 start_codon:yes stop_codon:yes gene_type:complete